MDSYSNYSNFLVLQNIPIPYSNYFLKFCIIFRYIFYFILFDCDLHVFLDVRLENELVTVQSARTSTSVWNCDPVEMAGPARIS